MFENDFLSIGLSEIVGWLVTLLGIWLVVKQLNEAKLASQMEGLLALMNDLSKLHEDREALKIAVTSVEWEQSTNEKAWAIIRDDKTLLASYRKVGNFFETIAVLVRSGALTKELAFRSWGEMIPVTFRSLEKGIIQSRIEEGDQEILEYWEWLSVQVESR